MNNAKQTFSLQFDEEIRAYAKKISLYQELNPKEELELARLAKEGDKFAKNAIIKSAFLPIGRTNNFRSK